MSVKSDGQDDDSLRAIGVVADVAASDASSLSDDQRLTTLENRFAEIEPLLELMQANSNLGPQLGEYIKDLQDEQKFFSSARIIVGVFIIAVVISVIILFFFAILDYRSNLFEAPPLAIATFIVGLISSISIMLTSMAKGVFRSANELHNDGGLPSSITSIIDAMHKLQGKN